MLYPQNYTDNGLVSSLYDANNNRTLHAYDGHDRLDRLYFPSPTTAGSYSTTDYEDYGYDANGNMLSKRARDGRTISFVYDTLDRLTQRTVPGSGDAAGNHTTFDFTYDLAGRQLSNYHWGVTIRNTYDEAGRLEQKTHNNIQPVAYSYDPAGNVTALVYPDLYTVSFTYDALNRVARACEQVSAAACATASTAAPTALLARIGYDLLSRRLTLDLRNGTSSDYGYTTRGDLTCHDWNLSGAARSACNVGGAELEYDFTYNAVGQTLTESVSDALLRFAPGAASVDAYVPNGLNQYASVDGTALGYDLNGNLKTDAAGRDHLYSAENQLYTVYSAGFATLLAQNVYYADGNRRYYASNASGATVVRRSYYDGDQEIAEYDSANTSLTRRYLRLPGSVDEPFLIEAPPGNWTIQKQIFQLMVSWPEGVERHKGVEIFGRAEGVQT